MSQTLATVFALNDKYSLAIRKIMQSQDDFEKKQRQMDKAMENFSKRTASLKANADMGAGGIDNLATKISGLVSIAYLAKKGFDGMFAAINTATLQKVQETTFQALLNSDKIGSQLYAYSRAYGKNSVLGVQNSGNAISTFLNSTRDMRQIEKMLKLTERLYAKNPNQGKDGALFAMKELLAGDTMSVKERYNMIGFDNEKIRNFNYTGDTEGLITYLDEMFNKVGATQEVANAMNDSLIANAEKLKDGFEAALGDTAQPIMENLALVARRLLDNLEAGKYQPFFNLMGAGMELIGNGIAFVADNATWLIPVVGGVVTGIIAYNVVTSVAAFLTKGLANDWAGLAALAVGVTATVAGMTLAMKDAKGIADGSSTFSVNDDLAKNLATTPFPTEITNTSPLAVKGEVNIEKENLQFLMDMAGQKFFAQYSHNTVIPQSQVTMNITKEVNAEEVLGYVTDSLIQSTQIMAEGNYNV